MPETPPYSREAELLLCCARTRLEPGVAGRLTALVAEGIHWPRLVALAHSNGVALLLHRSLAAACIHAVPEAILGELAAHCRANMLRSLLMTAELLRLLELFAAHAIRAVPFKGPVLAAVAYGDVGLREFYDLDLLVRRRDLKPARRLLVEQGFHAYRWNLEQPGTGLTVELHRWDPPPLDPSGEGTGRLEPGPPAMVRLLDAAVPSLGPEETLLALCLHGSKHCWDRLLWVCDVAQFVSAQPRVHWPAVVAAAARTGSRRRLLWGLLLARDLLGLAVPEPVLAPAAHDPQLHALVAEAKRRILWAGEEPFGHVEQWATQRRMLERRRDRLRFYLGLLCEGLRPNRTDRLVVPLPGCLHPLYYVIHPIRVIVTYGPRAVRRLLKRTP
ncbi:MAG TPA: nucleotidyltransferase family protein [Planctomycetota bacterium]|nr:nucleotidyltransferase family protein [Planctomycetota bacterium]HRR78695.1 nucleotidyltransferase family protein [Planctomycetota bacterium]HRT93363.1 nucleotidyltransferase family protein [Planctomycetota bacterium]